VVLEFELTASHLLGRHPTTWATSPTLYCEEVFFGIGSSELFAGAGFEL
jgi:hypothetical protein